ncbi:MAG: iron ABC transporter permease [Planctomycetota bacterium]|nr:iron ABC transporter permease [Planctomycetota bacterium]
MKIKSIIAFSFLTLLLAAAAILRLLITRDIDGTISYALPEEQFLLYRIVPLAVALIVGAGLGVSGMGLQVLLRNPLASPWILGLSSGAGLGVMGVMYVEYAYPVSFEGSHMVGAIVGALFSLSCVYLLSRRRGGIDPISMVLVGVVVSVICSAGIMVLQHAVPMGLRGAFTTWLMGRLPEVESELRLAIFAGIVLTGIWLVAWWGPTLDAACLSDDEAKSVGVDLAKVRRRLFLTSSVLASVGVILAGPIAFVGLIAPHGARLLFGGSHRQLAITTALVGAFLLVGADDIRQYIELGTGRLPIGIVTSEFGGLVFLFLLLKGRGRI